MALKEVKIEELSFNPFTKISKEWMLITAGDEEKHNTMTASWGGVGIMWGMNVATAYIRPQRYTKEFVDAEEMFTLSFFKEDYRKALNLCGSKSGRDCDKDKEAGLTPYYTDGTTAYEEADLIFVCRNTTLCYGTSCVRSGRCLSTLYENCKDINLSILEIRLFQFCCRHVISISLAEQCTCTLLCFLRFFLTVKKGKKNFRRIVAK